MKNINIHGEANIHAEGNRSNKNCKPVICIETGEVFASCADAAEKMGVHFSAMSAVCLGKIRTCKGMHFCYMNAALENLDAVMSRLREATKLEEDARKWREQEAEKERIRLEKEKRQNDIEKAKEKCERCKTICERLEEQLNRAKQNYNNAEAALAELLAEDVEEEVA